MNKYKITLVGLALALVAGCGDTNIYQTAPSGGDGPGGSGSGLSGPGGSGKGGGGTGGGGTGGGGTGGSGTGASSTGGSGTGASGQGGSGTGGSGTGGVFNPCVHGMVDPILISEWTHQPSGGEFIELLNPNQANINLDDYYISDSSTYHDIVFGVWTPIDSANTEFLARFPAGSVLGGGKTALIDVGGDVKGEWPGACPNYVLRPGTGCVNQLTTDMEVPIGGGIGQAASLLNPDEMIVLFCVDGFRVYDIDYVTYDTVSYPDGRMDKTGISNYQPETAPFSQIPSFHPAVGRSMGRCSETNGPQSPNGFGIFGEDETSENFQTSFFEILTPSPGVKNSCIP